jgi:hypothetical protein
METPANEIEVHAEMVVTGTLLMSRRVLLLLVGLVLIAVLGMVPVQILSPQRWFGKDTFPADPESLVLFSIDPTYRTKERENLTPEQKKADRLHDYLLLGKTEITDPAERQKTVYATNKAIRNAAGYQGAMCFNPRHVLRITSGVETVDVIICFECWRYEIIRDGEKEPEKRGIITPDAQPLLDKILTDSGVPLAPK